MSRTSRNPTLAASVASATVVTVTVVLTAIVGWMLPTPSAGATAQHAAGLVIDTGERVVTVYVEFDEETITGEELLRRADVDAVFSDEYGMGQAVCSILGVGSPKEDCFREAEENGTYWNYSRAEDGAWQRSSRGVSSTTVEHGDVDGWAWGPQGSEPPYYSFEEIRAQHAPEPSPSPTPTPTRTPTPTSTPTSSSDDGPPAEPSPEPLVDTTTGPDARSEETAPATAAPSPTAPPSPSETPTPTPSASAPQGERATATPESVVATAEGPTAGRGAWSLATFVVVMAALIGAIVWRRRDRSGTAEPPPRP